MNTVNATKLQFSRSVSSDSLWPQGLQHTRPPCPSPTPGACSNSCPSSRQCHPTIPSSVVPFFSCLQSFPVPGSFQMSQFFTSCGQSIGVSASTSVLPMNTQDWSPLGWTSWISLQSKGLSRILSSTTVQKRQIFPPLWSKLNLQLSSEGCPVCVLPSTQEQIITTIFLLLGLERMAEEATESGAGEFLPGTVMGHASSMLY